MSRHPYTGSCQDCGCFIKRPLLICSSQLGYPNGCLEKRQAKLRRDTRADSPTDDNAMRRKLTGRLQGEFAGRRMVSHETAHRHVGTNVVTELEIKGALRRYVDEMLADLPEPEIGEITTVHDPKTGTLTVTIHNPLLAYLYERLKE